MRSSRRLAGTLPAASQMHATPDPRARTRVVWGLNARPPVPPRAFLRFPVCPPGPPPSPAVPGFPSSGVLRFGPFGRCPVPVLRRFPSGFPSLSDLHVSAAAGRFRRRRSRAAGTKVTSPAATTSPGSGDPPALQMGSGRGRRDAAAESPVISGRERRTSPCPNRPWRFTHVTQLVRQRRGASGGRRHCAAPADGTGTRSRSFPPAGLAGSRGFLRSPGRKYRRITSETLTCSSAARISRARVSSGSRHPM
jgi:hypothetical protein